MEAYQCSSRHVIKPVKDTILTTSDAILQDTETMETTTGEEILIIYDESMSDDYSPDGEEILVILDQADEQGSQEYEVQDQNGDYNNFYNFSYSNL